MDRWAPLKLPARFRTRGLTAPAHVALDGTQEDDDPVDCDRVGQLRSQAVSEPDAHEFRSVVDDRK